jgi:hypothetical protein
MRIFYTLALLLFATMSLAQQRHDYTLCYIGLVPVYGHFYVEVNMADSTITEGLSFAGESRPTYTSKFTCSKDQVNLFILPSNTYAVFRSDMTVVYRPDGQRMLYTKGR